MIFFKYRSELFFFKHFNKEAFIYSDIIIGIRRFKRRFQPEIKKQIAEKYFAILKAK